MAAGFDRIEALCLVADYSFFSIHAWEAGKTAPSRKALLRLSSLLGCSVDDLLEDDEVPAGVA